MQQPRNISNLITQQCDSERRTGDIWLERLPGSVKNLFFCHTAVLAGKVYCLSAASFDFSS